jgi:hypothetical protein
MDTLQRLQLRALRYTMQPRTLWKACGRRRAVPALLALHPVCGGVGAISAAADIGRGMERHSRPMRRGQLGVHGGLQAEPDRGAILLPAGHPELVASCRGVCWPMRGGVRRWFLVGQQLICLCCMFWSFVQRKLDLVRCRPWPGLCTVEEIRCSMKNSIFSLQITFLEASADSSVSAVLQLQGGCSWACTSSYFPASVSLRPQCLSCSELQVDVRWTG